MCGGASEYLAAGQWILVAVVLVACVATGSLLSFAWMGRHHDEESDE